MATRELATMLIRIKPSNNREVHTSCGVSIKKDGGWYEVPTSTAKQLGREKMSELNPDASPFVFDVRTKEEAVETVAEETRIADPSGTVDAPRVVTPPATPKPPSHKKGGKRAAEEDDE